MAAPVTWTFTNSTRTAMFFVVPPSYYYKVSNASGTPVIQSWVEWTLF